MSIINRISEICSNLCSRKRKFVPLYDRVAKAVLSGEILTPQGNRFSSFTARNYKSGAFRFKLWEVEMGTIYLEDIDLAWVERFIVFLMRKGYSKNTISVTLARLKSILKRLYKQGIANYDGSGISAVNEQVTAVYTTIEEIKMLLDVDLSDTPGLERVRDIYVLQCFVGLRFRDFVSILQYPRRYLKGNGGKFYFCIKTFKTGEEVVIPVANIVKQILDKWQYDFGKPFSYQYYNSAIKEVALRAGITEEIVFTRTEGGKRVDKVFSKFELMSNHTARRTFATNAFLAGIPERVIMMITGHKTTVSFYRYIRCSSLDSAIRISDHDFFNINLTVTKRLLRKVDKLIGNELVYSEN